MEANGLEPRSDFVPPERALVDCPIPRQVSKPVVVRGGALLRGEFHFGDGVGGGLLVGALLCSWLGRRLGHLVIWLLWGFRLL